MVLVLNLNIMNIIEKLYQFIKLLLKKIQMPFDFIPKKDLSWDIACIGSIHSREDHLKFKCLLTSYRKKIYRGISHDVKNI